jgi:hypothetical protein
MPTEPRQPGTLLGPDWRENIFGGGGTLPAYQAPAAQGNGVPDWVPDEYIQTYLELRKTMTDEQIREKYGV